MRRGNLRRSQVSILLVVSLLLACVSCSWPFVWNADLKKFVEDGRTTIALNPVVTGPNGNALTVVSSQSPSVVTLTFDNPRSLTITCGVTWDGDSLYSSLPVAAVKDPETVTLTFTPSLQAEHKDLNFEVTIAAPTIGRVFPAQKVTLPCNTPPCCVQSTINAALDQSGCAFVAFRLPCTVTDDDLSQVEITYARADGTPGSETVTKAVTDSSLLTSRETQNGKYLLSSDDPKHLNRYYEPTDVTPGDDYDFIVVVIDTGGLSSQPAHATSAAAHYVVSYDGNGNTGGAAPVDQSTYSQTKTVTVLGQGTLTRTGYTFAGWNTAQDGSGTAYQPGDTFPMPLGGVTLYAQWTLDTYTVTYVLNGGPNAPGNPSSYTFVTPTITLAAPSWTGYTFGGWYLDAGFTTGIAAIPMGSTGNLTLYAKWTANNYTITFNSQGGNAVIPIAAAYGTSVTLPAATRTGYTFAGWNTAANGSGNTYAAGSSFTIPAGNLILFAQWTINTYTVSFDSQGGSAVISVSGAYQLVVTLPAGPVLAGQTFLSWNTAADGSGTGYAAGASFTVPANDVTLYAQWVANNSVVVTFVLNPTYGAITFSSPTVSVARGGTLVLSPTITGATNWHWYLDNVFVGTQTTSTFTWTTTGVQPGQYIINVDAMDNGYACTGSIMVTVTY